MILGMSIGAFTLIHVIISLIGIGSGFVVVFGLFTGKRLDGWTAIFLLTTVLTSLTGFLFPVEHILPSHKVGIISLVLLAIAIAARYGLQKRLEAHRHRDGNDGPLPQLLRRSRAVL